MGFHEDLKTKGKGAKDWINTFTEVEYLGDNKFSASATTGNRVFKDKTDNKWKKHNLTDDRPTKDYVLVQSAKCCVEVYPYYAKYYDVNHEEVRLYEERWVVQRLFKEPDEWRDVDAYNPVITVEEYSEPAGDVVKVTVTYDSDYGVLTVEYFQRDGNALKHNVTFKNTSGSEETFRVLQRWAGIVSDNVKVHEKEYKTIKKTNLKGLSFIFGDDDVPFKICESVGAIRQEGVKDVLEMLYGSREPVTEDRILVGKNGLKLTVRGIYPSLWLDEREVMISNEYTISTLVRAVEECPQNAKVFIGGLGLGVMLFPLALSHKTKEIIICEKDSRVIDTIAPLVENWFRRKYPYINLTIIQGDATVEVANYDKFDWIFMDIDISGLREICVQNLTKRGVYTSWLSPEIRNTVDRALHFESVDIVVHDQRLKADFIYSNWILAQNDKLTIDPDTSTLDDPTVDGYIHYAVGPGSYERDIAGESIPFYYENVRGVSQEYWRGYVEWDISSIPGGSSITKVEFRYHGNINPTTDNCYIYAMANQPSAQSNDDAGNQVIFDDAGDGTAYLSDDAVFPEVGTGKDVGGASGPAWDTDPKGDVKTALDVGWFALGLKNSEVTHADKSEIYPEDKTDAANPKPTLYVEYILPPANPLIGKPLIAPDIIKKAIIR